MIRFAVPVFLCCACATATPPASSQDSPQSDPPTPAKSSLERRCDVGDAEACLKFADTLHLEPRTSDDYTPREPNDRDRTALGLYRKACGAGISRACNTAGAMLQHGVGVARDVDKALAFYADACKLDDAIACHNLAFVLVIGDGVEPDPAAALDAFDRACHQGVAGACTSAAMLLERGLLGEPDAEKAASYLKRALPGLRKDCDADPSVCLEFARVRISANVDAADAKSYLRDACDAGTADACLTLAEAVDDNQSLLEKACELGDQCLALAQQRHKSAGSSQASPLYERACKAHQWEACAFAGPTDTTLEGLHFVRVRCSRLRDPAACAVLDTYEKRAKSLRQSD